MRTRVRHSEADMEGGCEEWEGDCEEEEGRRGGKVENEKLAELGGGGRGQ